MNTQTQALRTEPHVEIGDLLQRHAHAVVDRWCVVARAEAGAARRVHQLVLRDDLPAFLVGIGRALKSSHLDEHAHERAAQEHGSQRWDSGWSLPELIRDYQLLRLVIAQFLEDKLERPLLYSEMMAIGLYIDDAIQASIARYNAHRDEALRKVQDEQIEAVEDLSRRKDEFLAILGHELRNPLAPIRNSLLVLRKVLNGSNPAVATSLDVLDRQSQQLGRLVDDLLDLARISRGQFELRTASIELKAAIEQALHVTDSLIRSREHTLHVSIADEPIVIEADPHRLTQIAANLLNNAAKYTDPRGNIWLTVLREDHEAVIRVRDDGIGIPPEQLEQVFELFTRVEDAATAGRDGLGIGLALVQRLAHQHGGRITARSDGRGHGCEFEVRLPLRPDEAANSPVADQVLLITQVPVEKR